MDVGYFGNGRSLGTQPHSDRAAFDPQRVVIPRGTDMMNGTTLELSVRRARRLRDLRRQILGADYFSGPAWEVLLHLFESHVLQRRDTVGNVCDGTEVPATTVLRWINRLAERGLIVVRDDHLDNRRRFVALSTTGIEAMNRYFSGVAPHLIAA